MSSAPTSRPSTAAVAVALGLVYVVWGSTYLAIAIMVETLPPLLAAGIRFAVAGLLMLGALRIHARFRPSGASAERPTAAHWRTAFIVGTLLLLGGNGGVVLAEQFIPSGIAAVVVATTPVWLVAFDSALSRRRPTTLAIGGLTTGLIGAVILLAPVDQGVVFDPVGIGLLVVAEISWAAGSIYARRAPLPRSPFLGTGLEMLAGGIVLVTVGTLLGEVGRTEIAAFSPRSLVALAYLTLVGSLVGFTAYTWLLARVPVTVASTYAYVNPVVAVALGAVILAEPITLRTLLGTAIIIGAVAAIVSGRREDADEAGPAPEAATLEPE